MVLTFPNFKKYVFICILFYFLCEASVAKCEEELEEAGPELKAIGAEAFANFSESLGDVSRGSSIMTKLTTDVKWVQQLINRHNVLRRKHNAPPLVFNQTLCQISQAYADTLARTKRWGHNYMVLNRFGLGENLARFTQVGTVKYVPGPKSVDLWYDEFKDYNFRTGSPLHGNRAVGHFTQLVWRSTVQVGAAMAVRQETKNRRYVYVVANYYPRGNVLGQYVRNVLPKRLARNSTEILI